MNIIIYSKNRAMQLELLLRSMDFYDNKINHNITVIYTFDDITHEWGYERLKLLHDVNWWLEAAFKEQTLNAIDEEHENTVFFMDDMVCVDPVGLNHLFKTMVVDENVCYSTRLHNNITYSYPSKTYAVSSSKDGVASGSGCWGYKMSLDGNIFNTKDIKKRISKLNFNNPNELEYKLCGVPVDKMYYGVPCFINIPVNKVQDFCNNRVGETYYTNPADLNSRFLSGQRIKITPKLLELGNACHIEKEFEYE